MNHVAVVRVGPRLSYLHEMPPTPAEGDLWTWHRAISKDLVAHYEEKFPGMKGKIHVAVQYVEPIPTSVS